MIRRLACAGMALVLWAGAADAQSPPPATKLLTRIAFGSCANQELPQPIWAAVRRYEPELFLFGGDNVYGTVRDKQRITASDEIVASVQLAYRRAEGISGMRQIRESIPHLAIWDDGDFGQNDGGADFVHKDSAKALFAEFWKLPPEDPRRSRQGLYYAGTFGPKGKRVQVVLLDTRYFRSPLKVSQTPGQKGKERYEPDPDPSKTMLGHEQWQWLEEQLQTPADLRIIVSSIQVLAEGHGWERWGNLPKERERLLALLGKTEARGVMILSGDRHIGGIYRADGAAPFPLYELTSSGLTHSFEAAQEDDPARIGPLYAALNFGTVDIDWWARNFTLSVRSANGTAVRRQEIPFVDVAASK